MFPEAQDMLTSSQLSFHFPLGPILALTLLALLVSGAVAESGVLAVVRSWLTGGPQRMPAGVATAGHRS
jgi:hypothetical protein